MNKSSYLFQFAQLIRTKSSDPISRVPPAGMTSLALIKNCSDLDRTCLAPWPRSLDFNWRRAGASASLSLLRSPYRRSPRSATCAVCFVGGVYDYQACSESFKMDEKLWTTHCIDQRAVRAECIEFSHPSWRVPRHFGRVIRNVIAIVCRDLRRDHCGQNVRTHIRQAFPNVPKAWNSPILLFQGKFEGSWLWLKAGCFSQLERCNLFGHKKTCDGEWLWADVEWLSVVRTTVIMEYLCLRTL